jgi:hypothetical protein
MRLDALLTAAWATHLELTTLGQLAACCRQTHRLVTPALSRIGREFADEREEELLRVWSRVIEDGSVTDSDEE